MVKFGWLITCLLAGMLCVAPAKAWSDAPALASAVASEHDAASQRQTAVSFFETMSRSANPHIARVGRENLQKLRLQGDDRRITVSAPVVAHTPHGISVMAMLNGHVMGTFVVDTGASYTVITPRMARKLGVIITDDTPCLSLRTANGTVSAPKVTLRALSLGGIEVRNLEAVVHPLGDDLLMAGLLGMNAFQQMDVAISPNALTLTGEPVIDAAAQKTLSAR